jgi:hypothetical protein
MRMLREDTSGQFILLTGIIISIGMVILLLYLNQSSMAGHSSSDSIMSFPKNDIRDIRQETLAEAVALGIAENDNDHYEVSNASLRGQARMNGFNASFINYSRDLTNIYALEGCLVDVSAIPYLDNQSIKNASVCIYYYNSETLYSENTSVTIKQVP